MFCNFEIPLQLNALERDELEKKKYLSIFEGLLLFLFIITVIYSMQDEVILSLHSFFKVVYLFPFEFCPLIFFKLL